MSRKKNNFRTADASSSSHPHANNRDRFTIDHHAVVTTLAEWAIDRSS